MRFSTPLGFSMDFAAGWLDITDDLETGAPFTLARGNGAGAFQFSSAHYLGGVLPNATLEDLHELLLDFAQRRNLGVPEDICAYQAGVLCIGGSFRGNEFVRAWYLSDGQDFILATYIGDAPEEVEDCERMVSSIVFEHRGPE